MLSEQPSQGPMSSAAKAAAIGRTARAVAPRRRCSFIRYSQLVASGGPIG